MGLYTRRGHWIIAGEGDRPGRCLRCGAELNLVLPQPIEIFVAAAKAFVKIHLKCKEIPGEGNGKKD